MELIGKIVSPKRGGLNLNGEPELLVNVKGGRITLSNSVTDKLEGDDITIGFGYDPQEKQGSRAFLYITEGGCKVGKKGTVSSKGHSEKLKEMFCNAEGMTEETTRFKLSIDMDTTVDFQGTTLYPISFKEALADLTRTQKPTEEATETPTQAVALPCSAHGAADLTATDTEEGDQAAEPVEQLG